MGWFPDDTAEENRAVRAVVGVDPNKRTPCPQPDVGPDFAVENATYAEIQEFCEALSTRNGMTVRLPTDAGGSQVASRPGPVPRPSGRRRCRWGPYRSPPG